MEHDAARRLPRAAADASSARRGLVAFDADGKPDFERVCERMLYRHAEVPLIFLIFDVLSIEGDDLRAKPYSERRRILEGLGLEGQQWPGARGVR